MPRRVPGPLSGPRNLELAVGKLKSGYPEEGKEKRGLKRWALSLPIIVIMSPDPNSGDSPSPGRTGWAGSDYAWRWQRK